MLHIEIEPIGVRRVTVTGDTAAEQDLCLVVWPYIRPHLDRIDRALRREAPGILERLREAEAGQSAEQVHRR
jgi:hypothetical protein